MYDVPAYVRRARQVQAEFDHILSRCRRQREEWLSMVRLRLGTLRALAGEWSALRPLFKEEQLHVLQELEAVLNPQLGFPVAPTTSQWVLRQALSELRDSLERFNRRWAAFLHEVDVSRVNELREGYNRYYVLEKECALRSARVARRDFQPLPPLTREDVEALLPLLPVPR
jgi:hypothetical protein